MSESLFQSRVGVSESLFQSCRGVRITISVMRRGVGNKKLLHREVPESELAQKDLSESCLP